MADVSGRTPRAVGLTGVSVGDGLYRITGTTKTIGTPNAPVRRRVRLNDQLTGIPLREVWSDADTGEYSFPYIQLRTCCVIAFDHTGLYAPAAEADITPEPMP